MLSFSSNARFKVTGWTVIYRPIVNVWSYDITFTRLPTTDQAPIKDALCRPTAEETDDYYEYRRIRQDVRRARNPLMRARPLLSHTDKDVLTRRPSQVFMQQQHLNRQLLRHQHSHGSRAVSPGSLASMPKTPDNFPAETEAGVPSSTSPTLSPKSAVRPILRAMSPPLSPKSVALPPLLTDFPVVEGADERAARLSVDFDILADDNRADRKGEQMGGISKAMATLGI